MENWIYFIGLARFGTLSSCIMLGSVDSLVVNGHDQLKPLGVTLTALELSTYDNRAEHSGTDSYL